MGYGLFFALSPLQAQTAIKKFSLELKNESLPEALKQLEKAGGKNILFTYNGTESYRVTVSIREKTEREAIDLVLAGKPFLCIEREEYFVVQRKKSDKAIATEGKVYDEKGAPLPFVNILALAADSSFLAGSVTEEDGSFHLPPVAGEDCLLKATYIGYRPQIIPCRQQNTIRLQPDTELLKEVVITASRPLIERKDGHIPELPYRRTGYFRKRRLCRNQQLQNGHLQPGHLCFIQLEPIDRGQKQTNLSHLQRRTGIQLRNRRRPVIRHALHARHEHRQCTYYQ